MDNERQQKIDAMRRICDFLESHPEFKLPYEMNTGKTTAFPSGKADFAAHVRMLGSGNKEVDDSFFRFSRDFGGVVIELAESRDLICDRVVVGTKEIETEEADPVAVAAIPKVKVRKQVEIVEWRCPDNLLSAAQSA
jgi:hypothetical protein